MASFRFLVVPQPSLIEVLQSFACCFLSTYVRSRGGTLFFLLSWSCKNPEFKQSLGFCLFWQICTKRWSVFANSSVVSSDHEGQLICFIYVTGTLLIWALNLFVRASISHASFSTDEHVTPSEQELFLNLCGCTHNILSVAIDGAKKCTILSLYIIPLECTISQRLQFDETCPGLLALPSLWVLQ